MKKITSVIILIVMLMCSAFALTGCGEDTKKEKEQGIQCKKIDGVYTVYGFEGTADNGIVDIEKYATDNKIEIKEISEFAFTGKSGIKKIIVPNTVEKIGAEVFAEMPDLEELVVPFIGETAIADAIIGSTESSENKSVDLARTLYYWFCGEEFTGGATVSTKYNSVAQESTFFIPQNLKTIKIAPKTAGYKVPAYALYGNKVLENVIITDNVAGFGEYALGGCSHLKTIKLGEKDYNSLINNLKEGNKELVEIK